MKNTWSTKRLGELIELKYGKAIPKNDRKLDGNYPIYGANGELGRTDKYLIDDNALIIGRKGSVGELTMVSGKFWPSDVTYYVLGNEKVDINFIYYLLKQINLKRLAKGVKPGINRNKVYDIEVMIPSFQEQRKVVLKLEKILKKIKEAKDLQQEQLKELETLQQSVLNQAFQGKL